LENSPLITQFTHSSLLSRIDLYSCLPLE